MEGESEEEERDSAKPEEDVPQISLYALIGWSAPKTLRISATVNKKNVVALVDSGSTHNFISEKAADRLNLQITRTSPFVVRVANGSPLQCHGQYRDVQVTMGETMEFDLEGKRCILRGISNTPIHAADAREFAKEIRQGHEVFAIYVSSDGTKIQPIGDTSNTTGRIQLNFPDSFMNLEDKVLLEDGSNDETVSVVIDNDAELDKRSRSRSGKTKLQVID
ncbi:unnamed protein product [Microthlaspi erraticum]|uniref:Uncharacterized protein n=1 Tax=Microthlaspi erraticum TaxID=1685480 RepID=A0A6D2KTS3_9BRAS|nr:unnamed protein product [Microthlaspi erraticum]CAA7056758.1 unnamed protein product [Microthlaspi erraticum]